MDRFESSGVQPESTDVGVNGEVDVLSIPEVLAKDRLGTMAKRDPEKLAARLSAWISSN
jgi:hypothetical protein